MSINIPKIPRRIVTGHRNGVVTIIEDNEVKDVMKNDAGFIISDPWATDSMSAKLDSSAEIHDDFFQTSIKMAHYFDMYIFHLIQKAQNIFQRNQGSRIH